MKEIVKSKTMLGFIVLMISLVLVSVDSRPIEHMEENHIEVVTK